MSDEATGGARVTFQVRQCDSGTDCRATLKAGVFLLDRRGEVLHANTPGISALDKLDGLSLTKRRLVAQDSSSRAALGRAVALCCTS
jgi:hypothetical protein